MNLQDILSAAGRHKRRKRCGRGRASGRGKTSGRGHKGAGQRAGRRSRFGYEGGQNPALARIPQRGFNNADAHVTYQVVNVAALAAFDEGARVDLAAMAARRLVRPGGGPVKILGDGKLARKLTVVADAFSTSAVEKIRSAGGNVEHS